MRVNTLDINGKASWEWAHDLPPLWPWLFEPSSITESRRLHNTLFDGAVRFDELRRRTAPLGSFHAILAVFEEIAPDRLARELKTAPDAILALSLDDIETARPYRHEEAAGHWDSFLKACESGDGEAAAIAWGAAALSPIRLRGRKQYDARLLGGLALELGLERGERARALVWYLFGKPATHAARALTETWIARAEQLPSVALVPKPSVWKWLRG